MSGTRALVLLIVAAGMLALAALDGVVADLLRLGGLPSGAVMKLEPVVDTALAASGFVLIVVALMGSFRSDNQRALLGPYADLLRPFAAEFGRAVQVSAERIELSLPRDGHVVEVRLFLAGSPRMELRSGASARQSLAWFRPDAPPPAPAVGWRDVERTAAWRMTAELPVMARPLLADTALTGCVDRVFNAPWTHSVTHVVGGIEIDAELPPIDGLEAFLRACVDLTLRLRRVNG